VSRLEVIDWLQFAVQEFDWSKSVRGNAFGFTNQLGWFFGMFVAVGTTLAPDIRSLSEPSAIATDWHFRGLRVTFKCFATCR